MTVDFRASQIETNKIISSGSTGTGAKILIYDIAADSVSSPNQGNINLAAFNTSSIGTDVFLYVSGTIATGSSTSRVSAFGGSVVLSGSLGWQNNTYITGDGNDLRFFDASNGSGWSLTQLAASGAAGAPASGVWLEGSPSPRLRTSASVAIGTDALFAQEKGADIYFYASGSITSGSSADKVSVFGGSVRVSGVLAIGASSMYLSGSTIYTIEPTSAGLTLQNYNVLDATLLAAGSRDITLTAGDVVVSGAGGGITLNAGDAGFNAGDGYSGGSLTLTCGVGGNNNSSTKAAGPGGTISLTGGDGGANLSTNNGGAGGPIVINGGNGGTGGQSGGSGGTVTLQGGIGSGAAGRGGNVSILPGYNQDTLAVGYVDINSLNAILPNNDEFLVVSGTTDTTGSNSIRGVASFRGSIKSSGTFGFSNTVYLGKNGSDLIFFDDVNTTGISLSTMVSSSNTTKGAATTSDATPTLLWTLGLAANTLYDIDTTIVATGTGSGITKRFKRNFSAMNFSSTGSMLENTIFVPVLDVSGSSAASSLDVGFIVSGTQVQAYATGSASQSIKWALYATLVSSSNP